MLGDSLRTSLLARLDAIDQRLSELQGSVPPGTARRRALDIFALYPPAVREHVAVIWQREKDDLSRVQNLQPVIVQTRRVAVFVEEMLEGQSQNLSITLERALNRRLADLSLTPLPEGRLVLVNANPKAEYETTFGDFSAALFGVLVYAQPHPPLPHIVSFSIPRLEGANPLWRPLVVGHEACHLVANEFPSLTQITNAIANHFDLAAAAGVASPAGVSPGPIGLMTIARNWAVELACDSHCLNLYGPAGIAALAEFLDISGANSPSVSHPAKWIRLELQYAQIGAVDAALQPILDPFTSLAQPEPSHEPWIQFCVELVRNAAPEIQAIAASWSTAPYDHSARATYVVDLAALLRTGLPCTQLFDGERKSIAVSDADVVNAAWLSRQAEESGPPIQRLAAKSIADLEFLQAWEAAGGALIAELPSAPQTAMPEGAVLHADGFAERFRALDQKRIVVSPLLPDAAAGGALDLRFGRSFIVFTRSGNPSFNPIGANDDARSLQRSIDLNWGDQLILHPNELVLAATLEYISLPADMTGQVLTRSSLGRLGVLTATAVQIHPRFKGCLTLELANLSNVPVHLTPGQRIAQLVLQPLGSPASEVSPTYNCPTGPEFSRIRLDRDHITLRNLRAT